MNTSCNINLSNSITQNNLPASFVTKILDISSGNNYSLRSNILNFEQCDKWVNEFSLLTNTSWIVRNSNKISERFICRKNYVCHHSNFKKVDKNLNKNKSKNMSCPAKLNIKVKKTTTDTIKKDKYVKEGLVAEIQIFFQHSHTINTAEALGNLRSSDETRILFECYFNDGLGITEAIAYHEGKLELEGNEFALANASLNPKYRTVQHWHDTWRQNNLGPRIGVGVLENPFIKKVLHLTTNTGLLFQNKILDLMVVHSF